MRYEILKKAGHNIPFVFSKRLNELIFQIEKNKVWNLNRKE